MWGKWKKICDLRVRGGDGNDIIKDWREIYKVKIGKIKLLLKGLKGIVEGDWKGGILKGKRDDEEGKKILRRKIGKVSESKKGDELWDVEKGREGNEVIEKSVDIEVIKWGKNGIEIGVGKGFWMWEIVIKKRLMRSKGNKEEGIVMSRIWRGLCKDFGIGGRKEWGKENIDEGEGEFLKVNVGRLKKRDDRVRM